MDNLTIKENTNNTACQLEVSNPTAFFLFLSCNFIFQIKIIVKKLWFLLIR